MNDYIAPWLAVPLILIAWIVLALIIRTEVRRERASSTPTLDHTRTQAQGHTRTPAPAALRGVRQTSDQRSAVAGRAPHTSGDGWPADRSEHGSRAHQLQPEGGRQARSARDEQSTTAIARHPRLVTR